MAIPIGAAMSSTFMKQRNPNTAYDYEMLARAYGAEANACVFPNQYGDDFNFAQDFIPAEYNKISSNQLKLYQELSRKAIYYWDKIVADFPDHIPHIITDLSLKVANEHVHHFYLSHFIGEKETARKYLAGTEYDEATLFYARSLLDACDQNAILITHGDSDTYPLWYLQESENYRTDVAVLNSSLMQTHSYMSMVYQREMIDHELTSKDIYHMAFDLQYAIYDGENKDEIHFKDWVKNYKSLLYDSSSYHPEDWKDFPTIPLAFNFNLSGENLKLVNEPYYLGIGLTHFDIIASNPERRIYTTSSFPWRQYGLKKFFMNRCVVFELTTESREYRVAQDEKSLDIIEDLIQTKNLVQLRSGHQLLESFLSQSAYILSQEYENSKRARTLTEKFLTVLSKEDLFKYTHGLIFQTSRLEKQNDEVKSEITLNQYKIELLKTIEQLSWDSINEKYSELQSAIHLLECSANENETSFCSILKRKLYDLLESESRINRPWTANKISELIKLL